MTMLMPIDKSLDTVQSLAAIIEQLSLERPSAIPSILDFHGFSGYSPNATFSSFEDHLDATMRRMEDTIATLCRSRNHLRHHKMDILAALDRTYVLPVELLRIVFAMAYNCSDDRIAFLFTITQVCRRWRDIAIKCCRLWRETHLQWPRAQADTWLLRCHPLPPFIYIQLTPELELQRVLDITDAIGQLRSSTPCEALSLHFTEASRGERTREDPADFDRVLQSLGTVDLSSLEHLTLTYDSRSSPTVTTLTPFQSLPKLHTLSLCRNFVAVSYSSLVNLRLERMSTEGVDWVELLQGCSSTLENLEILGVHYNSNRDMHTPELPIIMHRLRTLHLLQLGPKFMTFLACAIQAPILVEMQVKNVPKHPVGVRHNKYARILKSSPSLEMLHYATNGIRDFYDQFCPLLMKQDDVFVPNLRRLLVELPPNEDSQLDALAACLASRKLSKAADIKYLHLHEVPCWSRPKAREPDDDKFRILADLVDDLCIGPIDENRPSFENVGPW